MKDYVIEVSGDFLRCLSSSSLVLTLSDVSWSSAAESPSTPEMMLRSLIPSSWSASAMEASLVPAREESCSADPDPELDLSRLVGSSSSSTWYRGNN